MDMPSEKVLSLAQKILASGYEYSGGGKIHIKKENRGKFTALKKRTGHSASWFKAHGTPAQKKMAVFALNAKKWKHADGGLLHTYGDGTPGKIRPVLVTPDKDYSYFLNSLPDNQRFTPESEYSTRRYWELNGKPRDFEAAKALGMYTVDPSDSMYHANTIAWGDDGIGYFMKPKHHDTVGYELDWYNNGLVTEPGGTQRQMVADEKREWNEFKRAYDLDTTGTFFRYVPKTAYPSGGFLKLFGFGKQPKVEEVSAPVVVDYSGLKTTNNRKYNPEYISYISDSLKNSGISDVKRASILANIIEESGGNPFALDSTGKFYGLLQWAGDRYTPTKEKDVYKEIDNQLKYITDTIGNSTDKKSWTHGGTGSGYNSLTEAMADFDSDDLDTAMKGFTLGYVRPTGKIDSYNNRLKVAKQLYDLQGFKGFDAGGFINKYGADADGGLVHRFDGEEEPTGYMVRGMWSSPSPSAESVSFPYAFENTSVSVPVEEPVVTTHSVVMPKRMGEAELLAQVEPATIQRDSFRNLAPDEGVTRDLTSYEVDLNSAPVTIPKRDTASYFAASASKLLEDATKFDPAGLTRDEVLALQRDMANNGYYSEQLNGMSKDEIKSIQTKLIKRGLLSDRKNKDGSYAEADGVVGNRTRSAWNEYNVDGRWGRRSDEAYRVKRKMATQAGDKRWEQDFREGVDGCARWVTQKFESVLGEVSGQNGVYGNAWQMPKNIVRKGGTMLFNLYDEGFDDVKSTSDLKKRTKAKLSSSAPDLSVLQPGDVVGIFFPESTHHDDVLKDGTTYNTHVGMIVSYDSDGTPIVQHNMGGNERKDRADKLPWGSQITVAARPQTSGALDTYPWQMGESRYEVELPEKFERLATDESRANLQTFMDSMAGGADVIGKIYTNADMDAVQRIAVGVLGRETGFMQNTESSRTGKAGARVKAEKLLRSVLRDESPETKSSDLSKFKLSNLSPNERAFLGIQSASDLEKPEKAGLASMYVLAKNYDYFVRYAKENPQLGLTPQDIEDLTALSYNQGMGRLYSVGATEFEGKLRVTPSKIQAIREAAASDETIDDFKATKLGRIAHEYPMLTNVMKELYNKGLGGRSSSYMNAARQAISNIKRKQN